MRPSRFLDLTQRRLVVEDVSGQPIGPIFKAQAVEEERLALEDGRDRLSRKSVTNYPSTLRNVTEERPSRCFTTVY